MKTINFLYKVFFSVFITIAIPAIPNAEAQTMKLQTKLAKEKNKEYKKLMQQYKKEGWQLADNSKTLEVALLEHLIARDSQGYMEKTGEVSKCKSINVGRMSAKNNAQNLIAQDMQGQIAGLISSLVVADAEDLSKEQDKMIAGFAKEVQLSLSGALEESYTIYKTNPDGSYALRTFFIVDKSKCSSAANSAIDKSLSDTSMAIEMANEIKLFVSNGMKVE